MPDAPREPTKPESKEPRGATEMEDFQERILEDLDAVQTRFRADNAGMSSETSPHRSRTVDEKRPELGRAGTSLSEGQAPYTTMRILTASPADSMDVAAPGGSIDNTHPDLPPGYGPEARPTVSNCVCTPFKPGTNFSLPNPPFQFYSDNCRYQPV